MTTEIPTDKSNPSYWTYRFKDWTKTEERRNERIPYIFDNLERFAEIRFDTRKIQALFCTSREQTETLIGKIRLILDTKEMKLIDKPQPLGHNPLAQHLEQTSV